MEIKALPLRSNLEEYDKFAHEIVRRWKSGNPEVIQAIKKYHPRLEQLTESDLGSAEFALTDAQLVVARVHGFDNWPSFAKHIEELTPDSSFSAIWKAAETALINGDVSTLEQLLHENEQLFRERQPPPYGPEPGRLAPEYSSGDARSIVISNHHFESWEKFTEYLEALKRKDSPIAQFEAAVDAIVTGEVATLDHLLSENPDLIRARSTRKHHATLLHYVGANGVEDFRQTTPHNAVKVLKILLKAGAEVDAMADMYGGGCTTMGLVVTSIHPQLAGVQDALIETLVEAEAGLNDPGAVNSCLAHGRPQSAESLALRGAPLDLEGAAGVGRLDVVKGFFDEDGRSKVEATKEQMKDGFGWACQYGRTDVVDFLLQRGMDVNARLKYDGQTGLHWAAYGGDAETVKLLLERNATVDIKDHSYGGTALGWTVYGWAEREPEPAPEGRRDNYYEVVALLLGAGASVDQEWLADSDRGIPLVEKVRADPRMYAVLGSLTGPSLKSKEGKTAADYARKRGLYDGAELLDSAASASPAPNSDNPDDSRNPIDQSLEYYEKLVTDLLEAYRSGDSEAMQRLSDHAGQKFTWERLRQNVELALGKADISLADARLFFARVQGFESWQALVVHIPALPAKAEIIARPVNLFSIDETGKEHTTTSARDWDTVIGLMKEKRIPGLDAEGQMTDAALERISRLDHVTSLKLGGSTKLTDEGLLHLARMPQLQNLDLSGWELQITDRGLAVLRHLTELRSFQLCWPQRVTDAGVANLKYCEHLESVDLLGTPTGDGAIQALTGKPKLRRFKTGSRVTDVGLPRLHEFPIFKTWQGGEMKYSLMSPDAEPNHLLIDGPFTDQGLAMLAGLDGLFGLSLFWHVSALTPEALKPLGDLPNLGFLGCEGKLCDDLAMRHIAALPRLRMLMAQGTVAGDDGFAALSRSQTIEYIWGRECPNLSGRGFAAMAEMPVLRGLAVSCANVDDEGLSALPRFPALRELMPMDVPDHDYRHIGRCDKLESLVLMYCRDTTDLATEHIGGLKNLKKYFASYTKMTDRSMEILSQMTSLEEISFYGCAGVTNAGVAMLASLPRLREIEVAGPQITRECASAFPAGVRVEIGT